jgi:hypothetical protein
VSVGIDQLAYDGVVDLGPDRRDDQQRSLDPKLAACYRLYADAGPVEPHVDGAPTGQPDPIAKLTRYDQTSGPVYGSPHGTDDTTVVAVNTFRGAPATDAAGAASLKGLLETAVLPSLEGRLNVHS